MPNMRTIASYPLKLFPEEINLFDTPLCFISPSRFLVIAVKSLRLNTIDSFRLSGLIFICYVWDVLSKRILGSGRLTLYF